MPPAVFDRLVLDERVRDPTQQARVLLERPADADEFVIWSICTNLGADPRRNAWSGMWIGVEKGPR